MAKNEFNVMFASVINESLTAARLIPDTAKKAEVLASLANAIARTGLVTASEEVVAPAVQHMGSEDVAAMERDKAEGKVEKKAETPKKTTAKSKTEKAREGITPKPDKTVEKPKKEETTVETPKEEPKKVEEKRWTTEWTEEAIEAFSKELEEVEQKAEEYGDDLNAVIEEFSEGKYHTPDDLNPMNIRAFLFYLEDLEQSLADDENVG